uniref:Inositol-1-monophosphatase n=1 Tax=Noctiluca scintillans TaxID=2966 RepID=A0A7S1FB61_NOCSC|mmetsp:Transcript_49382/g.131001  ORF Transcript_49382/g.131001 Transcript_49382/m.131001 type:complete len:320 (+) Transcript_49382:45-1004(+)
MSSAPADVVAVRQTEDGTPMPTLSFVKSLAREAGVIIRENHGLGRTRSSSKSIEKKAAADLVTEVDIAVEKLVTEAILRIFPDHKILGEESASNASMLTSAPSWVIDPIDGTTNFVHGNPFCAVSIGFYVDYVGKLGVVYNPILDELYSAEAGKGAHLESGGEIRTLDRRCHSQIALADALVGTGFLVGEVGKLRSLEQLSEGKRVWLDNLKRLIFSNHAAVLPLCRDLRRSGSAACDLCSVASGTLDAYWEFGVREWDIAAGIVICLEAGAVVTDLDGTSAVPEGMGDRKVLACCNEALNRELGSHLMQDGYLPLVTE